MHFIRVMQFHTAFFQVFRQVYALSWCYLWISQTSALLEEGRYRWFPTSSSFGKMPRQIIQIFVHIFVRNLFKIGLNLSEIGLNLSEIGLNLSEISPNLSKICGYCKHPLCWKKGGTGGQNAKANYANICSNCISYSQNNQFWCIDLESCLKIL